LSTKWKRKERKICTEGYLVAFLAISSYGTELLERRSTIHKGSYIKRGANTKEQILTVLNARILVSNDVGEATIHIAG